MAVRILSLPGVTLGAAIEALLVTTFFPHHLPEHNAFVYTFLRFLALNYALLVGYWGLIYPFFISPLRHFPSPKGIGSLFAYSWYMNKQPPGSHFLEWSKQTPNDGVLLLRSFFHRNRLLLTKPKALADVLVAHPYNFEKPARIRNFLRNVLGDGLIIVEGDPHKFQRKHLMPSFNFRHLKDLYPMMWRKALALTEQITVEIQEHPALGQDVEKVDGIGTTEITGWASKITLDIIGVAGLGAEFHALKNSDNQLVKDYEELLEPNTEKLAFFFMSSFSAKLTKALPWKMNRIFEATTSSLRSICRQLVRDKREAMKIGSEEHFDILSLLIRSNDFSDDELVDQLLTFLAAGHETTSSAFTWVCFLLATHPNMQQTLRNEVRNAFPTNPASDPTIDLVGTLEKLPWLNAVCNETLRLFPTVPNTIRVAIRPTQILHHPNIPRGTEVFISPWVVNRSPDLWGLDSEEFKPERWIDVDEVTGEKRPNNSGGADSNYCLLSFLHGPRSCIGQNFAKAELRCLVAAFVNVFEWSLDMPLEEVTPAGAITIKPKSGLRLKLKTVGAW